MRIVDTDITAIIPYEKNPRVISKEAVEKVAASIKEFGFQQPIVVDKNGIIIVGHTRLQAAKSLGLKKVPVLVADNLSEEQVKAYRLADNKTNEFTEWNLDLLTVELTDLMDFDMEQFGFDMSMDEPDAEDNSPYTMNVDAPIYQITGENPDIKELVDMTKVNELKQNINSQNLPSDIKGFLEIASYRHAKFDYKKIAEFYAHADKETQELMEQSALVIIDFQSAIKNGFTRLSNRIAEMRDADEE